MDATSVSNFSTDGFRDHTRANIGWRPVRGAYSGRGRGYSRGGRQSQVHRNKTLVLNGATTSTLVPENNAQNEINSSTNVNASPAWVTKTDRHLQLINPTIFEKQSQQRTKAMEETRKLKLKQRDERERLKFNKHLQRVGNTSTTEAGGIASLNITSQYEISLQGVRFRVVKNGSKLMKVPGETLLVDYLINCVYGTFDSGLQYLGDENAAKATPKFATVGGVKFYRSKNGNLYRSGIVKGQRYGALQGQPKYWHLANWNYTDVVYTRRRGVVQKINEPCKAFSTTGSSFLSKTNPRMIIY
jgi:hypothetical protein